MDPEQGVVDFSSEDIGFGAVGLGHVMSAARIDLQCRRMFSNR